MIINRIFLKCFSLILNTYTNDSHESWCDHDGSVGIWSLNRRNFDSKKPNVILETDCCITCVAFNPEVPALLAAGKFNGMFDSFVILFKIILNRCDFVKVKYQ